MENVVWLVFYFKATPEFFVTGGLAAYLPLNRMVLVKPKHNLLSAGADHVYPIIIVYQSIVWLFPCGLRGISIRYLLVALPIKGRISLHNHVTYAHNSGIRRRIYGKYALYMPYCPLMNCYFYTSTNGERQSYMFHGFSSLSPLMDWYFYTSANGEMGM